MTKDITEIYDEVPIFAVDETGKALITEEQYSWLCNYAIRMAERVQELEELIEDYKTVNKELHQRGRKVRKQNKRYREALEEIARGRFSGASYKARKALESED